MTIAEQSERHPGLHFTHAVCRLYARLYHRMDVVRFERMPATGPAILVANHTAGLDPILIQSVVNRPICWMVAREYYEIGPTRWLYDLQKSIPVDRNGKDTTALRTALRRLDEGHVLAIFPEGTIAPSRELLRFQTGVGLIAQRARVPVYPVRISGTGYGLGMKDAFTHRQRYKIAFGPPLHFFVHQKAKEDVQTSTNRIEAIMATTGQILSGRTTKLESLS